MEQIFNVAVFIVFALLWAGFVVALVWSQGSLDQTWQWITGLPLIVRGVVWLLFLPVVTGLWTWETSWPLIWRLVLVGGLGFVNIVAFLPRTVFGGKPQEVA